MIAKQHILLYKVLILLLVCLCQLAALGASMQMMGFIGFIIGARYQITAPGEGQLAGLCVLNILLAGASSGLYGLILQRLLKSYYDVDCFINTTIAGMVCTCT